MTKDKLPRFPFLDGPLDSTATVKRLVSLEVEDFWRSHTTLHAERNEDVVQILESTDSVDRLHFLQRPHMIFGLFCGLGLRPQVETGVFLDPVGNTPREEGRPSVLDLLILSDGPKFS